MALLPLPASGLSLTVRIMSPPPRFCLNRLTWVFEGESLGFLGARGFLGLTGFSGSFCLRFFGSAFRAIAPEVEPGVNSSSSFEGDREGFKADGKSGVKSEGKDSSSELSSLYIGEFNVLVPFPFLFVNFLEEDGFELVPVATDDAHAFG